MKAYVANGKHASKAKARRRNPLPLLVGNPQRRFTMAGKRKAKKAVFHRNRQRANPVGHHRRRRRNPGFLGDSLSTNLKSVLAGAAGLLGDVYVPSWLLGMFGMPDQGVLSYALALGIVALPAWALDKAGMKDAAKGWLVGSGAGVVFRLVDDFTGSTPVTIGKGSGIGAFTIPGQVALPGPNVFATLNKLAAPVAAANLTTPAGSSSQLAISKGAAKAGMGYFLHGYRA